MLQIARGKALKEEQEETVQRNREHSKRMCNNKSVKSMCNKCDR